MSYLIYRTSKVGFSAWTAPRIVVGSPKCRTLKEANAWIEGRQIRVVTDVLWTAAVGTPLILPFCRKCGVRLIGASRRFTYQAGGVECVSRASCDRRAKERHV